MDHFLTIAEAATALRVSRATIYNLINDGHLRRVKVRNRALITRTSLDAYVKKVSA